MKKIFTLLFMGMALAASAADYTDELTVTAMGSYTSTSETTISVVQDEDGTYTLTIPNLSATVIVMSVHVGTLVISGIEGTDMGNGNVLLSAEKEITVQAGDDESVTWVGPSMGELPVTLNAVAGQENMYAELGLSMTYMNMDIAASAVFGSPVVDTYAGELEATISGSVITDESTVYVTSQIDGTYTLQLKNFVLTLEGESMYVGTINIEGIEGTAENGGISIASTQNITIENGDDETVTWLGPLLQEVPVELSGTIGDGTLYVYLSIEAAIGTITVEFNGSTTNGIQAVATTTGKAKQGTVYTISGTKAPAGYKGVVIENGRKVIK